MSLTDKPRERLVALGSQALSDSELLAVMLRSGGRGESALLLARKILSDFDGFSGLCDTSLEQLTSINHIGLAKATCIKAACEIALRIADTPCKRELIIKSPEDIYRLLKKDLYRKQKEKLILISVDTRCKYIGHDIVSVGTVNETLFHPREIFRQALLRNAVSIVLAHNHPTQDPTPSSQDVLLTENIAKASSQVGICLMDHVVVCDDSFCSMKALGLFKVVSSEGEEVKESGKNKSV